MIARTLAAIALFSAVSLPAAAQYDDSANINAAFAQGQASEERPETANEYWTCAAFWHVWSDFAADEFGEAMMVKLAPPLAESAGREAFTYWEGQAALKMGLGMAELDAETELYIELQTDKA